ENTPKGTGDRFFPSDDGAVTVLEGTENNFGDVAGASYHHASGLNLALKEVKTRFVLILDPDFFIIRKNWIEDVLEYMTKNELVFFGAPYNPKRYMKYRYFPCIHCMFIDLDKVSKSSLDFSPQYDKAILSSGREKVKQTQSSNLGFLYKFFNTIKNHLRILIKRNKVIGSSRDTGYLVYKNFGGNKSECLEPVFKLNSSSIRPSYLGSVFNLIVEKFLPDNLCYIPKMSQYYSKLGFKDIGAPDAFTLGWDEFLWKGRPFGFHMQGANKGGDTKDHGGEIGSLREILNVF
ncbi:MAG TPA: hypothetical protein VGC58_01010, partial [Candidatus Paceibacterota bacterium]